MQLPVAPLVCLQSHLCILSLTTMASESLCHVSCKRNQRPLSEVVAVYPKIFLFVYANYSGAPLNLAQTPPPNRHFEQYGRKRKNERKKPLCRHKRYEALSKFSWLLVKVTEAVYSKSRIMFATVRHNYLQTCLSPAPS